MVWQVTLGAGESVTVTFTLNVEKDLSFIGVDLR
jgi:hypothetical protein